MKRGFPTEKELITLGRGFYTRDVLEVAPDLIGKFLIISYGHSPERRFIITEVEAYRGTDDKACHASKGRTARTEVMFHAGGKIYVYFVYGMYWMLNIVTGENNDPQAVLIRGVEGISGPGRVTRELKIDGSFYPNDDGVPTLGLSTNKWNAVYATNNVIQTSDSRMKKEITDINYGLSTILQLHPVSFKWIDFPEQGVRLGLLAQEVQSIVNEIVDIGDDPEHILGLRYSELIPILIKGMQEQQSLIERQKERNVELEKKLEDLALRLDRLESK